MYYILKSAGIQCRRQEEDEIWPREGRGTVVGREQQGGWNSWKRRKDLGILVLGFISSFSWRVEHRGGVTHKAKGNGGVDSRQDLMFIDLYQFDDSLSMKPVDTR